MQEMIFGDAPSFAQLMEELAVIEATINERG
jgi:hypothetical protein